jgi:cytochrome c oxidase subunit III
VSRPAILHEPWERVEEQHIATHFGVWMFLASEVLFFGALLMFYAVSRVTHSVGFDAGARHADLLLSTINTVLLLTSSMTLTVAERAAKAGLVPLARAGAAATVALGTAFLAVKGFEYRHDLAEQLFPGPDFPLRAPGASLYWAFYWVATGIHAVHLTAGLALIVRLLLVPRDELARHWITVEGVTLYWHLVDIVWLFLFPLLYLVGR